MYLIFYVWLERCDPSDYPGDDDDGGEHAWECTRVTFSRRGCAIAADLYTDGITGHWNAVVLHDDFALPVAFAQRLVKAVRDVNGFGLLEFGGQVESLCDLQSLITSIAYYSESHDALSRIRKTLSNAAEARQRNEHRH